jgi:hypothetical protein
MCCAIDFYNEFLLAARKVREIRTNRQLPNELEAGEALGLDFAPQPFFG